VTGNHRADRFQALESLQARQESEVAAKFCGTVKGIK
jgi:hypothetical protein